MISDGPVSWDVLDQLSTFVGKLAIDGTLESVNRHALEAANLAATDVIGKKFWDCYWWQVDERTPRDLKAAFERAVAGEHVRYDATVQVAGGQRIIIDFQMVPVLGEDGDIDHVIPSGNDITARVVAQQESRTANNILNSLFQSAPFGIAIHNSDHSYFRVNDRMAEINGLPAASHVGRQPDERFGAGLHDEKLLARWDEEVIGRGETVQTENVVETPSDGTWRRFRNSYFPVNLGDGITGVGAFVEDVTERINARRERDKAQAQLDALFRAAPVGMSLHDHELRWTHINDHLAEINGLPVEAHIGRRLEEALPTLTSNDMIVQAFHKVLSGEIDRFDLPLEDFDPSGRDQGRHLDSTFFPVKEHGRIIGAGVVVSDVSDRVNAERGRELLLREMNHRIKNTIATIQAFARQTLRNTGDIGEFEKVFNGRLSAMASANDAILSHDRQSAPLRNVIRTQTGPFGGVEGSNLSLSGPDITVPDRVVHSLALVLHELSTNATKYGAWSDASGRVSVDWTLQGDRLSLHWREAGGPPVKMPDHRGFGSRLIDATMANHEGGVAEIEFLPAGIVASLCFDLPKQDVAAHDRLPDSNPA